MRRLRQMMQDTSGLTVAEVIVAIGIIMIGLVSLMAVAPLATSQVGESKLKTTAVFLAQQRLERVKNAQWTSAPLVDSLGGAGSNGGAAVAQWPDEGYNTITFVNNANAVVASYPQHRRVVRITSCDVAPGCGIPVDPNLATLRQVTVTVFFRPMTGVGMVGAAEDSVQLTTLIAQRQ